MKRFPQIRTFHYYRSRFRFWRITECHLAKPVNQSHPLNQHVFRLHCHRNPPEPPLPAICGRQGFSSPIVTGSDSIRP